jgi:Asp-tRNA(Asn)/Glu-tRNA(Gln) amidotransferase A subunit family amidase
MNDSDELDAWLDSSAALDGMPIAVQIITAPWREDVALRIAYDLEAHGIVRAAQPPE